MGRTASLRGAETDDERVERILTWLELTLRGGVADRNWAKLIILGVAQDGLKKTADGLTKKAAG